jgi:glycosyltransferase involved in cell wall biosynthesis
VTAPLPVCVNGRFSSAPATGVQRYARCLVDALSERDDVELHLVTNRRADRFAGLRGHLWEQTSLPRQREGRVLLSPANWGPVSVRAQLLVLQDVAPLVHPEYFSRAYVLATRAILPRLVRQVGVVAMSSSFSRDELLAAIDLPPDKVIVAGAGLDASWFDPQPRVVSDPPYAVFVGGHDTRKNLGFALRIWPDIWREHGLRLVVTRRGQVTVTHAETAGEQEWLDVVVDPDDARLRSLYAGASVLVWPSHYEGFGLPLLEAAALGTPFVSSNTGASSQLAVRPWQIQPLDVDAWQFAISQAVASDATLTHDVIELARSCTWQRTAQVVAEGLSRLRP